MGNIQAYERTVILNIYNIRGVQDDQVAVVLNLWASLGSLADSGLIFSLQFNVGMPVSASLTYSSVPSQAEPSVTCTVFLF